MSEELEQKILAIFAENKMTKIGYSVLRRTLDNQEAFEEVIKKLELEGKIYQNDLKQIIMFPSNFFVTKVKSSLNGTLYIEYNNEIIKGEFLKNLLLGDIIICSDNNKEYNVEKILKRTNNVVCELRIINGEKIIKTFNTKIKIHLNKKDLSKLMDKDRFTVRVKTELEDDCYEGELIDIIGNTNKPNNNNLDYQTILLSLGLRCGISKEALKQAEELPNEVSEKEREGRVDLRDKNIFTIDGKDCQDMDDAVGAWLTDHHTIITATNIAHVSYYIPLFSPLFNEASKNCFSVYMPGFVEHMYHEKLANGIGSLNPGVDRLCRTTLIEYDLNGNVISTQNVQAIINSKIKMNYEDLNKYYEENDLINEYEPFKKELDLLLLVAKKLELKRIKRGAIDVNNREMTFLYDENGDLTDIEHRKNGIAERMIASLMIESNEKTISILEKRYDNLAPKRNHNAPTKEKMSQLLQRLRKEKIIDEHTLVDLNNPFVLQNLLHRINYDDYEALINVILSYFERAYYTRESVGHFGLGIAKEDAYTQSTSPMRQIIGTIIQYLLDLDDKKELTNEKITELEKLIDYLCEEASAKERLVDQAERLGDQLEFVNYIKDHLNEEFVSYIDKVKSNYLIVKFGSNIDGIIFFKDIIGEDKLIYNKEKNCVHGENTNITYRFGHKLRVKAKEVDFIDRVVYFELLENLTIKEQKDKIILKKKKKKLT